MSSSFRTTAYRTPDELFILGLTLLLVFAVIAISAAVTLCASFVLVALAVFLAYSSSQAHHRILMERAYPVTDRSAPELAALVRQCVQRLQPGVVQVFVTPSNQLNAYTFGLSDPRVVVLYSALFDVMDADELRFVFGHELGHVQLGHTRINSLLGGMAGIPSSSVASALLGGVAALTAPDDLAGSAFYFAGMGLALMVSGGTTLLMYLRRTARASDV